MFANDEIVPVVMFHSVGLADTDWVFSHVSETVASFDDKIDTLCRAGYSFLFWDDLYDYMAGRKKVPKRSIMITFDDGYLDNWVYVYPILKKYGAKATIFVNPDFVDHSTEPRKIADIDKAGKFSQQAIPATGFLNWAEMQAMEASGLVDIQSHALTHTWYYSGPTVIDFHRPGNHLYPWLAWNVRPERKPYYMVEDQDMYVAAGMPVYEYDKALVCRRYYPPDKVLDEITKHVHQHGGADYFQEDGWKTSLMAYHSSVMEMYGSQARLESDEEYKIRVYAELNISKQRIEENLGKRVNYICWPGGGYNATVVELARKAGYRAWTLGSKDQSSVRNLPGVGPEQVKRVGSFSQYRIPGKSSLGHACGAYFRCGIERHKGSFGFTWIGRAMLAGAYLRYIAGGK